MKKIKPKLLVAACTLLLFGAQPQTPQTDGILRTPLKDGVERWHRVKALGAKPWFFQQVENLFNVVLPPKDQLPFGVSVALLVGVSEYAHLSQQLPFVKNDLADMRAFLLNDGGFDTVYVASEKIVNRDLIDGYVRNKIGRSLKPRDRFLFYYSGHGADNRGKTGYMQFAQAVSGDFVGTQVLPIRTALDWSSELNINHQLFVFDCCASGLAFTSRGGPGDLLASLSGNGCRMIMTAGTAEEKTYEVEGRDGKGNGVFTRAFLNAARSGSADKGTGRDGFITIEEIFAQVKTEIGRFKVIHGKSVTPDLEELDEAQYRGTFVFVNPQAQREGLALREDYSQKLEARAKGEVVAAFGKARVIAFLSGQVYIDDGLVDTIDNGDVKEYPVPIGSHKIAIRGVNETVTQTATIAKGQTTTVTLQPKRAALPPVVTPLEPTTSQAPEGMVHIKGGTFMMGSDDSEAGSDEKPVHEVYVKDFYLDQYEVTVAKFKQFVDDTGYKTEAEKEGWSYAWTGTAWEKKNGVTWKHDAEGKLMSSDLMKHPVIHVSWNDAKAYAKWKDKRLPTEAEWEYAARSGSKGYKYAWGNGNPVGRKGGNIADESGKRKFSSWTIWSGYDDGYVYTAPIGSFEPNEFKLYDMTGNVWEWCEDWYDANYYQKRVRDNPQGPAEGTARVLRGGSWDIIPQGSRCAVRLRGSPTFRNYVVGFRCAQDGLF